MFKHGIKKRKTLRYCTIFIFMIYLAVLSRIILFKQVGLYNLSAAFGAMERNVSILPFHSLFEMISDGISVQRILENVLGNITIFIPFGLLLPVCRKGKTKGTIIYGLVFSLSVEALQFIFALGSSDIDDLIFNTSGVIAGYAIYKLIRQKSRSATSAVISIIVFVSVAGTAALGILFVTHTELFMLSRKDVVVENGELVQNFIDTPQYVNGKFAGIKGNTLTVEKSVHNAAETRPLIALEITPDSNIYKCYNETDYFFNAVSGEHISYEQMETSDFISQEGKSFTKDNNVLVWSTDGKTIEHLVIVEWTDN